MSPGQAVALVVDDSAVNRKVLARLLTSLDIESREAANGREALDALGADGSGIDIVLLDIEMPELDGYDTLEAIKGNEALRHLPVIMISAVEELASVVRCIAMGATDYLPKPFDPAILEARVRASLSGKRLHDLEVESAARQAELLRTIERQKDELSRFLSPQVAALVSSPEGAALLAGHRRIATTMFADLRGFTPFSEATQPEEVLGVLRDYHRAMGELIVEHGGTLEHFAGDGMMIFFNDPVLQDDHVERAVRMAIEMRDRFNALSAEWARRGHRLGFGVGIDTGYATLGRIGFEGRYDYGMVGMAVIRASRLSSAAAEGQILISPASHAEVDGIFEVEELGEVQLKGFSRPISPVNVIGPARSAAPQASSAGAS